MSGFDTGSSIGSSRAAFGGAISLKRRSGKALRKMKIRRTKATPAIPVDATLTGCELDGHVAVPNSDRESSWADARAVTEASVAVDDATLFAGGINSSRGNFGNVRFYFRFDGSSFAAAISSVSAATFKVYFDALDNSADADVNKWKAFKHNKLDNSSLGGRQYRNDNHADGFDTSISGDEATVSAGAYISFPITGDLLSYVSTQAQTQKDVAFMLVCKLDYDNTAPTGVNTVTPRFTDYSGTGSDPKLDYTYT